MVKKIILFVFILSLCCAVSPGSKDEYHQLIEQGQSLAKSDPKKAEILLNKAKQLRPEDPLAYIRTAFLCRMQNRLYDMGDELRKAIRLCRNEEQKRFCKTSCFRIY